MNHQLPRRLRRLLFVITAVLASVVLVAGQGLAQAEPSTETTGTTTTTSTETTTPTEADETTSPETTSPEESTTSPEESTTTSETTTTTDNPEQRGTVEVRSVYVNTGEPAGLGVEVDDGQVLGTPFSISHAPGAVKLEPASNPPHASLITSVPVYAHVDAGETVTVTFEFIDTNAQNLGRIDVSLRDRATGAGLGGGVFELRTCEGGTIMSTIPTADDGSGIGFAPDGCYRMLQTSAPAGYRAAAPQTVYIHPGEPIMVTVYNEKIGYVEPRNPAGRTPLQSIPSGPVWRP